MNIIKTRMSHHLMFRKGQTVFEKNFQNPIAKIITVPEIELKEPISYPHVKNSVTKSHVSFFMETLKKEAPTFQLNSFSKNAQTLLIFRLPQWLIHLIDGKNTMALYNPVWNCILYQNPDHLFHELSHVATTAFTRKGDFSGFNQCFSRFGKIGLGLNELYTEIFTERHFKQAFLSQKEKEESKGKIQNASTAFFQNMFQRIETKYLTKGESLCSKIESIIGQEKMENYYSTMNLEGLILDLEAQGESRQSCIRMLYLFDVTYQHLRFSKFTEAEYERSVAYLTLFCDRCLIRKKIKNESNKESQLEFLVELERLEQMEPCIMEPLKNKHQYVLALRNLNVI